MLHTDIETRLSAMTIERQRRQMVSRLVSALECSFNIQQGNHLVLALGDGHENSNHDALRTWVNRQMQQYQIDSAASLLPKLSDELNRCLVDWQNRW